MGEPSVRVLPPDVPAHQGGPPPPPPPRRRAIPPAILIGAFALVAIVSLLYGYRLGTRENEAPEPTDTVAPDLADTAPPTAEEPPEVRFRETTTAFVRSEPGHEVPEGAVEYLNRNIVWSLAVAADGFIWTAGPGGVVRWDPRTGTGEPQTLPDGTGPVDAIGIAAGPDGDMWVTTASGISHWDGEAWLTDGVLSQRDSGTYLGGVAVAPDGSVWVAGDSWDSPVPPNSTHLLYRATDAFEGRVTSFAVDRPVDQLVTANGSLWAVTGGEVWRLEGGGWIREIDGLTRSITGVAFEPNGRAWVTVGDGGVMVWDGVGLVDVDLGEDVLVPSGVDGDVISVAVDDDLVPWALVISWTPQGSATQELVRLDDLTRYPLPIPDAPSGGRMVAAGGRVWVATRDGLLSFDGTAWSTLRIPREVALPWTNSTAVDAAGNLWMSDGLSLVRWNGRVTRSFTPEDLGLSPSPAERSGTLSPSPAGRSGTWVAGSPDGIVWAGAGCQASMLRDGSWLPVVSPPGAGFCWEGRAVGTDGSLWVLDSTESGPRLDHFVGEETTTVPLPDHGVSSLAVASDGTLWAAGTAVSRLTDDGWVTELDGLNATTIAVAADDSVWVGERCWDCDAGAGSNLWHLAGGTWTRVGTQTVIAMVMAHDGTGWALIEDAAGGTHLWRNAGAGDGVFWPFHEIGPFAALAPDNDGGVWAASDGRLLHITP